MAIVNSLLDNDLYKFTMQYAVMCKFPDLRVRYKFIDRNNKKYPKGFNSDLAYEIIQLGELMLRDDEANYLKNIGFFPNWYIDFLKGFRMDPSEIQIDQDEEGYLNISIEGYWYRTILWEVPLMAIISELYFSLENEKMVNVGGSGIHEYIFTDKDREKAKKLLEANAYYADFGTRRRYSRSNQERIVDLHKEFGSPCFVGTSNVKMAMKEGIKAIGTMAHEWIMVHGALYGYKMSNRLALQNWADVYDGDLGIALSDTYTSDVFFKSFDKKLAKLFDGVRQDSGDPFEFIDKTVSHYQSLGIDPMSKVIIFSDGLNVDLALKIKNYCVGKIKSSFGIGTNFTNDVGANPLNIVIKISDVELSNEWYPAIKLSDDSGKYTGEAQEVKLCKQILRI